MVFIKIKYKKLSLDVLKKLIILFIFFCGSISAQTPVHFSTKDGLPSNNVYDVLEDKNGFIWFATNRGLSKFNGKNFKNFTLKDGLPHNNIWQLEIDQKDRLWYLSKSKYQGYVQNDSIYKFKTEDNRVISPRLYQYDEKVHMLSFTHYTFNEKEFKNKYKKGGALKKYKNALFLKEKYKLNYIHPSHFSNNYIGFSNKKMIIYNESLQLIKQLKTNFDIAIDKLKSREGVVIYHNHIAVINHNKGILFLNHKNLEYKYYSYKKLINNDLGAIEVNSKVTKNDIQITADNYLLIFNHQSELKEKIQLPKNIHFKRAFRDSKGNIWMVSGTGTGVHLLSKAQLATSYILQNEPTKRIGKINNNVLVGVEGKGIYQLNKQPKYLPKFNKLKGKIYQIGNNIISADIESYIIDNSNVSELFFRTQYRNNNYVTFKDFLKHNDSIYTITSFDIAVANNKTHKGRSIQHKIGLFEMELFKNEIYTGGSDGLWKLQNDSLIRPVNHSDISIKSLTKDNDFLYVGTDGRGVYVYNKKAVIPLKNTDDFIIQRIRKKDNKLWLATQKGVVEVAINKEDIANSKIVNQFLEADGLLQNNTNDIYIKNDTLYALSDIGIAKLNTKSNIYKQKPNLYFKTYEPKTIITTNDSRNISQTFGVKSFSNQKNIKYEYRLLPTQQNWQPTKTQTLNFSNLSPNNYTLQVKATDQHFNTAIKLHSIIVEPFWYETIWAKIFYGIASIIALLLVFKLIQRQIKKQEQVKAEREKRIAGLELQALRSQMNPHFVHNSLNAIQYFIQRNEVEQSEDYLAKFSKLVREFFEYSRRQTIAVKDEISLLKNYLEIEKLRFEEKLSFIIKVDKKLDIEEQIIPSMILQPLVENAVNHGIFHKKENGTVKIYFQFIDEDTFVVKVEDDGIGMEKSKQIYKRSTKNYQSRSSAVLQERLKLLQQSKDWQIAYSINDLSKNSNQTGTLVRIQFKQITL